MVPCSPLLTSIVLSVSSPVALAARQAPDTASPRSALDHITAERYEPVFEALRRMAPRADRVAPVHDLTLRRDVIRLHLTDGQLYLLTPVASRTVGAVFVGHGSVSFAPPLPVEREQLRHVLGDSVLDTGISAAVLIFTDSTLTELERRLSFGSGSVDRQAASLLGDALDRLLDGRSWETESSTLMSALLNGNVNGFFYGRIRREQGEDLTASVSLPRTAWYAARPNDRPMNRQRDVALVCGACEDFDRHVLEASWRQQDDLLELWIEADTFMRHMVRTLVGTMLTFSVADFAILLERRPRAEAGETAPPHGLYLESVTYRSERP